MTMLIERTGETVDAIDVFCVDDQTEILTTRGWLRHDQLRPGDMAMSVNPETLLGEWTPVLRVNRFEAASRRVLSIEGRCVSSLTTEGHRWLVDVRHGQSRGAATRRRWEFRRSTELTGECTIPTAAPVVNLPTEQKYSDALVEIVAWYWTEGHDRVEPQSGSTITQSAAVNPEKCDMIRRAMTALFGPDAHGLRRQVTPEWTEYRHRLNAVFAMNRAARDVLAEVAPGKTPTWEFLCSLTQAQLDLFIDRSIDADGTRSGVVTFSQKRREWSDLFQAACLMAGRSAHMRVRHQNADYPMFAVAVHERSRTKLLRGDRHEWIDFSGMVWCPTTGTGTWLARRSGTAYFTGNCGFGGSSQGIHAAGADVIAAANHNPLAIECHSRNFPDVDHWRADLVDPDSGDYMDPAGLPKARFAWFSPGCTHHSQANAKKIYERGRQTSMFDDEDDFDDVAFAKSERSRVTMSCVLRYASVHKPEIIVVENVVEVCHWGPARDGSTFQWWMRELRLLGYEIEPLFLNSSHFMPCPQSRDRIYIVAWRSGNQRPDLDYRPTAYCTSDQCGGKIVKAVQTWKPRQKSWPLPKWGKYGTQYIYTCPSCSARVEPASAPAYSAIDWTRLGQMLCERDKPLAPATMERIRRGLRKFAGSPPIIIPTKAVWGVDKPVTGPMPSQTTQQDKALVTEGRVIPFIVKNNGAIGEAKYRSQAITDPLGAVTANPTQALATSGITLAAAGNTHERPGQTRARDLHDALYTQHTTQAFGFAHVPFITEMRGGGSVKSGQHHVIDPLHSVTAGGMHHGLATPEQLSPAIFQKINGAPGDTAWHHLGEQFGTITGRDTTGLVILPWVDQWQSDPIRVTEQMATVMTHMRHALASLEVADEPVSDEDLMRVRFRMLDPDPELRRAMAFGAEYILIGNKTQMTSGLGNAVTPPVAAWVTEQCLATLRGMPAAAA